MTTHPPFSTITLGAITFRDRNLPSVLSAARNAGFESVGITVGQCIAALERGIAFEEIAAAIRDAGLRVGELELIRLGDGGPARHANALVVELASILQPDRVHVAAWGAEAAAVGDEFASVCAQLAPLPVAYEFMPYNSIPSFTRALELVESTAAPNAKIVLDILHFFRSGSAFEELTADALSHVAVVQLSDVIQREVTPSLVEEARHRRTYPGAGDLNSLGFLQAIAVAAEEPVPLSIEPISDALELLPLMLVAEEAMLSTQRLLKRALKEFEATADQVS
ncbi:sugar phosphate isomerase/epimerase family protein [Pseudarthrobacter sp. NPDC055928]|uniref:sugar phosphate isomerase/epimerase family protein n=1 Tax=Pseudarthrobacter sp. NPDC055928 TaxID=3345661 RepID=UPI0035DB081C